MNTYAIFLYDISDGSAKSFQGEYWTSEAAAFSVLVDEGFKPPRNLTLDEYEQFVFDQDHALCVRKIDGLHKLKSF